LLKRGRITVNGNDKILKNGKIKILSLNMIKFPEQVKDWSILMFRSKTNAQTGGTIYDKGISSSRLIHQ
jgi:hypothetical protein